MNNKLLLTKIPVIDCVKECGYSGNYKKEDCFFAAHFIQEQIQTLSCILEETDNLNNIYVGKVDSIAESIHAVFIRISKDEICYLPYGEVKDAIFTHKPSKKEIAIGDELLVQVNRRKMKTKQASLTTKLTLTGKYVILTAAKNPKISVSKKLSKDKRNKLLHYLEIHWSDFLGYDIIARTNAETVTNEVILEEALFLSKKLHTIVEGGKVKTLYSCVYKTKPEYISFIEGSYKDEIQEIITDIPSIFEEIKSSLNDFILSRNISLRFYEDSYPLYQLYSLKKELDESLSRKVWLKSGAYLIIDPTEALTVIDVNSGKNEKKSDDYFLKINLEAAKEIARQLKLRNISGICIVDFIDMTNTDHQTELISYMKRLCKQDHITTTVVDMTKLHLMEITRKKTTPTLYEQILQDIT